MTFGGRFRPAARYATGQRGTGYPAPGPCLGTAPELSSRSRVRSKCRQRNRRYAVSARRTSQARGSLPLIHASSACSTRGALVARRGRGCSCPQLGTNADAGRCGRTLTKLTGPTKLTRYTATHKGYATWRTQSGPQPARRRRQSSVAQAVSTSSTTPELRGAGTDRDLVVREELVEPLLLFFVPTKS
jgi:hypothetical protein